MGNSYTFREFLSSCLGAIQGMPLYRRFARFLFRGRVEIGKAVSGESGEPFPPAGFTDEDAGESQGINAAYFVARRGKEIIGHVQLVERPGGFGPYAGYWLHDLNVAGRYRGMGVGELLTRKVEQQALSMGATQLLLGVDEKAYKAIRLYGKLGFQRKKIPEIKQQQAAFGVRQIIMAKELDG